MWTKVLRVLALLTIVTSVGFLLWVGLNPGTPIGIILGWALVSLSQYTNRSNS